MNAIQVIWLAVTYFAHAEASSPPRFLNLPNLVLQDQTDPFPGRCDFFIAASEEAKKGIPLVIAAQVWAGSVSATARRDDNDNIKCTTEVRLGERSYTSTLGVQKVIATSGEMKQERMSWRPPFHSSSRRHLNMRMQGKCLNPHGIEICAFRTSRPIWYNPTPSSEESEQNMPIVLIETDKSVYRPGQTVKGRLVVVSRELKPIDEKVSLLYILDASGVRVVQWTDISLRTGIAEFSLPLSSEPVLGRWEIHVQLRKKSEEVVQDISIDKYALPKFSVDAKLKCASSGRGVCVEIDARYTHGQPVKGKTTVQISISDKMIGFGHQNKDRPRDNHVIITLPSQTIRIEKQAKRLTEICLPFSQIKISASLASDRSRRFMSYQCDRGSTLERFFDGSRRLPDNVHFSVESNFTEDLTGVTLEADKIAPTSLTDICKADLGTTDSQKGKWQIEFTNLWGDHIKSGLPLPFEVTLVNSDGKDVGGRRVEIACTFVAGRYTSDHGTSSSNFFRKIVTTKKNGRARLQVDVVPCDARLVTCTASVLTLNVNTRKTFLTHYSKSGSYLSLSPAMVSYKAGELATVELCLLLCEEERLAHRQLNYMVVSRRSVVHSSSKTIYESQLQPHCKPTQRVSEFSTVEELAVERSQQCADNCNCTSTCGVTITLPISPAMTPAAQLIVYTTTSEKDVILDALEIKVSDPMINKVNIQFESQQTSPGKKTRLRMSAHPGSLIGVTAVDKSLHFLGESNQITKGRIEKKIETKEDAPQGGTGECGGCRETLNPDHDTQLMDPLMIWWKTTGLTIATTLDFGKRPCASFKSSWTCFEDAGSVDLSFDRDAGIDFAGGGVMLQVPRFLRQQDRSDILEPRLPAGPLEQTNRLAPTQAPGFVKVSSNRVFFPETWIFKVWTLRQDEAQKDVIVTVPDSITSWSASAFAISQQSGLGVSDTRQLTVFQPFFLSMKLPYSVIRGEILQLVVSVFNYVQGCMSVTVALQESSCYNLLPSIGRSQELCLCTDEAGAAVFNMTFGELGLCPIVVEAATTGKQPCQREGEVSAHVVAVDRVTRKLKVDPEGVEKEATITSLISKRGEDRSFAEQVSLTVPPNIVRGSGRSWLTISSDLMAPSLQGLGDLLRLPYGCGEQNMINFAPGVSIALYLKRTNQLDDLPEVKDKATTVIQQGYQRENRYRHGNGGYSVFGESKHNWGGSTACLWLTSFVVKSFCKAKATGLVYVDESQVCQSLGWMIRQQNSNGGFANTKCVSHRSLQGGLSSDIGHTAYICSSLLDTARYGCSCGETESLALKRATKHCIRYLVQRVDQLTSVYQKAIVCYVLRMAKSEEAETVCGNLRTNLKRKGETCHLQQNEDARSTRCHTFDWRCRGPSSRSSDIEMTAYGLLGDLIGGGQLTGCLKRWLAEQQNSRGGYSSTQDTVVALDALSETAHSEYSVENQTFNGSYFYIPTPYRPRSVTRGTFHFDKSNRMVVQKQELRPLPGMLHYVVEGHGSAVFQISTRYNVREAVPEPAFNLSAEVVKSQEKAATVRVCTRWTHGQSDTSNMALITFEMPSGYIADEEILSLLKEDTAVKLERYDVDGKNIFLYFFEIGRTRVCFELDIKLDVVIGNLQPSTVRIQDYYQPELEATVEYSLSSTNKCPVNQTFSECEAKCSPSCPGVVSGVTLTCGKACVPGCRCKKGFAKIADRCILETECASALRSCGANQIFKDCVTPCPARCQRGVTNLAAEQCVCEGQHPGCECVAGYVLDSNGRCVLPTDCVFEDM